MSTSVGSSVDRIVISNKSESSTATLRRRQWIASDLKRLHAQLGNHQDLRPGGVVDLAVSRGRVRQDFLNDDAKNPSDTNDLGAPIVIGRVAPHWEPVIPAEPLVDDEPLVRCALELTIANISSASGSSGAIVSVQPSDQPRNTRPLSNAVASGPTNVPGLRPSSRERLPSLAARQPRASHAPSTAREAHGLVGGR